MDAECEKCGSYYVVRENCDPTPFCDECAHAEVERLREWIRSEGVRTDACTYDVLGEICDGCRCKRCYEKQGYGKPPNEKGQRPGLKAGVERNETKGKSNE